MRSCLLGYAGDFDLMSGWQLRRVFSLVLAESDHVTVRIGYEEIAPELVVLHAVKRVDAMRGQSNQHFIDVIHFEIHGDADCSHRDIVCCHLAILSMKCQVNVSDHEFGPARTLESERYTDLLFVESYRLVDAFHEKNDRVDALYHRFPFVVPYSILYGIILRYL